MVSMICEIQWADKTHATALHLGEGLNHALDNYFATPADPPTAVTYANTALQECGAAAHLGEKSADYFLFRLVGEDVDLSTVPLSLSQIHTL